MDIPDVTDIQDALQGHAKEEGDLLLKWACVVEWLGEDGTRRLKKIGSEGCPPWDVNGMLFEALYHFRDPGTREE